MPTSSFKPVNKKAQAPGGNGPTQYPVLGIVKDNIDATRSGRIKVTLQDGKGSVSPDDNSGWITVQHLSTFFGVVRPNGGTDSEDYGSYVNNPSSYGQWQAPPDIGTKVVCIFVNGDLNAGYYIGCVTDPETLQMVPAIGASESVTLNEGEASSYGGATRLPVTNLNTNNTDKANSDNFLDTPRPVHSYSATIMNQQGIIRDPIRGPISSSASREAASRVGWGVSTPGRPIYEGGYTDENLPDNLSQGKDEQLKIVARRGGHSIVMDDGDIIGRDQLIRIRTALGHQILMSDDGQTLMILHSNGQSYIELGKEGTVDIFSTNSINMRTQGDFNIHADRDINMHAMENFNLQAKNIHTNSDEITKSRAGKEYSITALNNFTVKASSAVALAAGGQASLFAGAEAFVNGTKVNLNSGSPSLTPPDVPIIPITAQTDTLFDDAVGWAAAPAKLLSIASRAPAHYPWVNAGMGVDISNSPNAADNLPAPSSTAVQQTNAQAEATSPTPPAVATVASVPPVPAATPSLGSGTTNAVLAATATSAAAGETAKAVATGAGVVEKQGSSLISGINSALKVVSAVGGAVNAVNQLTSASSIGQAAVAVGAFAQSADQLSRSGVLKPGASNLVNGLASAGKSLTNTMPTAVFAGAAGAETVAKLAANPTAQATSATRIMQTAQQELTQAGVINGTESTTQTAGLIAAASTLGTAPVVGVVKQATTVTSALNTASTVAGNVGALAGAAGVALPGQVQTALNVVSGANAAISALTGAPGSTKDVLGAIGKGISAAKLSDSLGGLGGIANSLNALADANNTLTGLLDSVKGISGSAFSAIKDTFGKLEANKPQNLAEIAKEKAAKTAVTENTPGAQPAFAKSLSNLVTKAGEAFNEASKIANDINNSVNSLTGSVGRSLGGAAGVASSLAGPASSLAGTVNSITGTVNSISGAVNSLTTTINSVSGTATGTVNAINRTANSITNVTTTVSSLAGAADNLAKLPNTINVGTVNNSIVNAADQLATTAGSVVNTVKGITNTVNNLENAGQQITTLINSTTGAGVDNLANSISGAVDNINSLAGAATSLKNGLSGLANAAKKAQGGGLAARAAQLSSGVSNLPGGIKAFSSVLDKAEDAINKIPGTSELTGLMADLQTEAVNGLGKVSSALSSASTTLGQVESALNTANKVVGSLGGPTSGLGNLSSIASKAGGLTSSIASKLPIGQATQLLTSVSALGAGGASPIKLPSLGVNTTNRTGITAQIKGILGDPKIPIPNLLGDILGDAIDSIEKRARTLREERQRIQAQLDTAKEEEIAAGNAFIDAFNTLPAGDPSLAALEKKFQDATSKTQGLIRELENVGRRRRQTAQPSAQDTVPPTTPAAAAAPPATGTGTTT
jgi:methyl-accepting chemotaxis protein